MDIQLVMKAAHFAAVKHRKQSRKGPDADPYIIHPLTVARELVEHGIDDAEIIAAALLHDTIEDTGTTPDELEQDFGARVRDYVLEVTDDKSLDKAERKRLQFEHAPHLSPGAAAIKMADKIANIRDVANDPPPDWSLERRQEYLDWTERVVNACPEIDAPLKERYHSVLEASRERLQVTT